MSEGFRTEILVGYYDIFDEKEDKFQLLNGINRDQLLHASVFFLGFANGPSRYDDYRVLISMFFCEENKDFAKFVLFKIENIQKENLGGITIINGVSSLELFEYALAKIDEKSTFSSAESEINLFKAYLLFNYESSEKDKVALESVIKIVKENYFSELVFSMSFANFDLTNYNQHQELINQFYKSILLFEFLESKEQSINLLHIFLSEFECKNWQDFLKLLLTVVLPPLKKQKEGHTDIIFEKEKEYDFEYHCSFIDKLCISNNEILAEYDYITLRSKPVYKFGEGKYRIIFDLFTCQLLHLGLYFKLSEINNKLSIDAKVPNFRNFYTFDFSEKHLSYHILERIFSRRNWVKYSGQELDEAKVVAPPDYYIRNGNKVLLFESKDVLFKAEIKASKDYEAYESELKKKFYFTHSGAKKKNKAILQLINSIEILIDQKNNLDVKYKPKNLRFYPIVLTHSSQFDTPGLNKILNKWFTEELTAIEKKRNMKLNVMNLTIINIDSLIYFEDHLQDSVDLFKAIENYHFFTTFNTKKKYKSEEHFIKSKERTLIPFSTYFLNYMRDKNLLTPPSFIREHGFKVIS
jgi:hypothetical protein